jgi:hypothetical protein
MKNFKIIKELFKNQIHERYLFSLNCRGNNYQGIYHDGNISWFNTHPLTELKEMHLKLLESKVNDRMQKLLA